MTATPPIGGLGWICSLSAMSASQKPRDWRARWLPDLFWIGVGLAPVAAVLLLLSQGGAPLRVAAVLAIFSVVLIGLSVTLRQDLDGVRVEIEESVLDEADAIREETREDIVTVARKMHTALREEIAELADQLEQLRGQVSTERGKLGFSADSGATPGVRAVAPVSPAAAPVPAAPVSPAAASAQVSFPAPAQASSPVPVPVASARAAAPSGNGAVGRSSAGRARVGPRTAASWTEASHHAPHRPAEPYREYVDPARAAAERRQWDPLNDDLAARPHSTGPLADRPLADRPVSASPVSASPISSVPVSPAGGGRRRAPEPDEPTYNFGGNGSAGHNGNTGHNGNAGHNGSTGGNGGAGRNGRDPWADLRSQPDSAGAWHAHP